MIAPVVSLKGRDFIDLADLDRRQLRQLLDLAHEIKAGKWSKRPLQGRHIAMLFQKPSHRTRVSFEVGIARLGGSTTTLTECSTVTSTEWSRVCAHMTTSSRSRGHPRNPSSTASPTAHIHARCSPTC